MDGLNIIIVLLITIGILIYIRSKYNSEVVEGFDSSGIPDEALLNMASIYNNKNLHAKHLKITGKFNFIPRGTIVIWNGTVSNIPSGWVLCDGKNGTPNMINYYPLGHSSSGSSGNIIIRATGDTNYAGNHKHSMGGSSSNRLRDVALAGKSRSKAITSTSASYAGNHKHTVSVSTASKMELNFFNAIFIMKT